MVLWYSRSGEMSLVDKLILGVCLLHPIFLSDVPSDVVGVTCKYSADSVLANCKSSSTYRLVTCVFSKAEIL